MAKVEDYMPGGQQDPAGGVLEEEITDATQQQQARQRDPQTGQFVADATPQINWEERYSELEKLNSRQAQTLGDQRKMIDEFITNPSCWVLLPSGHIVLYFRRPL